MTDTGVHKRGGMRGGALLPVLLSCAFMVCGLAFGFMLVSAVGTFQFT
jgi:hypothetical protein